MIKTVRDAWNYLGFLNGLRGFLQRRITHEEARAILLHRMERREETFLSTIETCFFGASHSPYPALFEHAGCEFGDIADGVKRDGVEATLRALLDAGVYVTFEEFKGRVPIVRGGHEIPATSEAFDNKLLTNYYQVSTGGSTGSGRLVAVDLNHMWSRVPDHMIADTMQGFMGRPLALWLDGLPGGGVNSMIQRIPSGITVDRWFCPTLDRESRPALKFRLAQAGIITVGRMTSKHLVRPEPVRLDQPEIIARWAAETLERDGACGLRATMSRALRVCLAAEDLGIDLTGLTIAGGGEPPTPAKVAGIQRSGATLTSNYGSTEAGPLGHMCMNGVEANDQHFMAHHLALITRRRLVPGFDREVDALCYTTLLPQARKLMLNVETDDYGIVEERSCGCPWEEFGLTTHIRGIHSFQKMSGEGMTLVENDIENIIEDVLPSRFGGSAIDYQLHEEEDERGFTRVSVVVSPRVGEVDETAMIELVLQSLGKASHAGDISRVIWQQAGALRVKREEPTWTSRGKLMPLHIDRTEPPGAGGLGS